MIYFVSDIHLGGNGSDAERTERAFCRWLDMVAADAEAIYLLGDVFDFWFEYRRVVPQGFTRVLGRLAALTDRGTRVVLYTGNHDMWCYDYLTRECGIRIEFAPRVEECAGCPIHLAHGDNLNVSGDVMLSLMNGMFRSRVARWLFRWLIHPDLALKFGSWWSGKSRKSHGSEQVGVEMLRPLVEYAKRHHREHDEVRSYIFGHMHLAHRHEEEGMEVLFLSDWSRDVATYAALTTDATLGAKQNIELRTFQIDETVS